MTKRNDPWYCRNHAIWMASLPLSTGALVHFSQYRPFIFLASWLSTYEAVLYTLFVLAGVLAGLGMLIAYRRKTSRSLLIATSLFSLALLMIVEISFHSTRFYNREEVTFNSGSVTLSGTLYKPRNEITSAMVLVHGSVEFDRGFYHLWADYFAQRGMAVLSFDKRGTGASGGVFVSDNNTSRENLDLLASDVAAGLNRLSEEKELAQLPIGIWGISQAGWIVPIVATRHSVDFVLLVSGPTCTTEEEHVYSRIRGDHAGPTTGSREEAELAVTLNGPGGFDPVPMLSKMDTPGLWIFGAADDSIPVGRSTQILDSLVAQGSSFEYHVLPDTDHILFLRKGFPDFNPSYWKITTQWLQAKGLIK